MLMEEHTAEALLVIIGLFIGTDPYYDGKRWKGVKDFMGIPKLD